MKELIKRLIRKILSWYIDPLYAESASLQKKLDKTTGSIQQISSAQGTLLTRISDIEGREEWTRSRFEEHLRRISDIEGREQWARERFEAIQAQIGDIEGREQWTRERFEAVQAEIGDIQGREEWARGQLEEHQARIGDIEGREQWTRERFEAIQAQIGDIQGREEWTRGRFEEHQARIGDIEGREQWTRERFEALQTQIDYSKDINAKKISQLLNQLEQCRSQVSTLEEHFVQNRQTFSQSGEDAIAAYILQFLQIPISDVTYLDLGANHAKVLSNTYAFYCRGARGVLVEANPELIPELKRERPEDTILNCAITFDDRAYLSFYVLNGDGLSTIDLETAEEACRYNPELRITGNYTVKTIHIGELLENYFGKAPTILSIDLEGIEEQILKQINYKDYAPWIIILENIPYTPLLSAGQREYKCVDFLKQRGYVEYAFTGINSIFVLQTVIDGFNQKRATELKKKQN